MPKQAKDFVFNGKETFEIGGVAAKDKKSEKKAPEVILNIDEDDVLLSKNGKKILGQEPFSAFSSKEGRGLIGSINRWMVTHSGLKSEDKSNFFHLLSVMINSGVPMIKSLKSLKNQVKRDSHIQIIITELLDRVESGQSLSDAMSFHKEEFSEMEIGMIEAGEASGHLNETLEGLANDIMRRIEVQRSIKGALMYPIAIVGLLVVVLSVMMIFVIPKLESLFESSGNELPTITKIVIAISDFMTNNGLLLLAGTLGLVLGITAFKKTNVGRFYWDMFKLRVPIFGGLFKKTYLARFARSLASLLGSGVPIIKSLEITSNAVGNEVYKRKLYLSGEDMKQGIPLAENLIDAKLFPPMIVNMVEVGEKTAQLEGILTKVAAFYEEDVKVSVTGMSRVLEPVVLIVIGLSVGAIAAAVMLPIMNLSDLAGSL